ncbi:MAG TPA: Fic family protein [Vicinamibacterales bacterium]|nr:Fic family protein [Vicinamibacterales bacterium]
MPKSFENGALARQPLNQGLLQSVRLIGEYRGKEALFKQQSPQVLQALRESALIQSTESSNRIEGVVAPPQRIRDLVAKRTQPANRSEQEIAGYRDVLNTIHTNFADMRLTSNLVLQLHRDLFRFVPGGGGRWKATDNDITETRADGTTAVRFKPLAAHLTPDAMARLDDEYRKGLDAGSIEPLLAASAYVLDFLCIHPFAEGNGRMARLLSLLLLYQAGYEVGRYISLESVIEGTKEGYYDSLYASSQRWHEAQHSLVPWWEYFVGVMLVKAYRDFEDRVGVTSARRGAKRDMIRDAVERLPIRFRYADLERALPAVSRPTIARALRELRAEGAIRCLNPGRDATWEKIRSTV